MTRTRGINRTPCRLCGVRKANRAGRVCSRCTAAPRPVDPERPDCRHCQARKAPRGRRGLCWACWGDPAVRDLYPPQRCHCGRPAHGHGLCQKHYDAAREVRPNGKAVRPAAVRRGPAPPCACGRPHLALGLCNLCYQSHRRANGYKKADRVRLAAERRSPHRDAGPGQGGNRAADLRPDHLRRIEILAVRAAAGLPLKGRGGDILDAPACRAAV